ncbi:MAG: thioesterase family protein [Actinomycetes bacterium]
MSDAVYLPLGDERFQPTVLSRGPWSPDHQHGGAPTALLTRAVERIETAQPMRIARITCEFLGAVPIAELAVSAEVIRPGRRVQWVEAKIECEGQVVMRARALTIRVEAGTSPEVALEPSPEPGPDGDLPDAIAALGDVPEMFAGGATEIRLAGGKTTWTEQGPGRAWFRLKVPLVEGEQPTPQQRAVSAADFGNGIGAALDWGEWLFVNADLSVNLLRQPRGEWISLDSTMRISGDGTALSESRLADLDGGIGVAAQSLFVAPSPGASSFGRG